MTPKRNRAERAPKSVWRCINRGTGEKIYLEDMRPSGWDVMTRYDLHPPASSIARLDLSEFLRVRLLNLRRLIAKAKLARYGVALDKLLAMRVAYHAVGKELARRRVKGAR